MLFPKAKKIAKQQDWFATNQLVFGLYKKYLFQIGDASLLTTPSSKFVISDITLISEEQRDMVEQTLTANKKALKFSTYAFQNNTIVFTFNEHLALTKITTIYALLDFLTDLYARIGLPISNYCQNCKETSPINFYNLNEKGIQLCSLCTSDFKKRFYRHESDERKMNSTYSKGVIGALLFSIPGIIMWIIVAYYFNTIYSALALVLAVLGYLGYIKFNGKKGSKTLLILSITNFATVILANLIVFLMELNSAGYSLSESFHALLSKELFVEYTRLPLFLSTIFCIVATLFLVGLVKKGPSITPAVKIKG
ncbi:hypothetical protein [Myroides sp. TSA_177.3]|uniref:hypothetical protein n=1 Tax=Myroides sp. TSA_177.3 TaxID=3415650 RepID=UPI0040455F7A